MKQIHKPSNWLICIFLIPAVLAFCFILANVATPLWAIVTICVSIVSYLSVLTYYCIRQKCYGQLVANYVVLALWCVIYFIQFQQL